MISSTSIPFRGDPLAQIATVILTSLVVIGLVGLGTHLFGSPTALSGTPLSAPGDIQLLGTDQLGRSVLARTVAGIRQTILLSSVAVMIAALIGALLGMLAGYLRGLPDEIIARGADVLFSFPAILLAIMISAILQPGSAAAIAAASVLLPDPLSPTMPTISPAATSMSAPSSARTWPRREWYSMTRSQT